jgi:endonuclease/exonuclease/phosphatase family metal-dependent hydrolase
MKRAAIIITVLLTLAPTLRAQETRAEDLRLFTWNVGTCDPRAFRLPESSVPRVIDTIAAERPDVVTLQEVCSPEQAGQIARALRERGQEFRTAQVIVDGRRDDGRLAVTLYRGEAEVVTHQTSNGFGILATRQRGVTIVNIHAPISAPDRTAFFREVAEWVKSRPAPVIVVGDYNCGPGQGAGLAMVFSLHRLRDTLSFFRFSRELPAGTRPLRTNLFGLAIDHVRMTSGRVRAQRALRGKRLFPMDHDPLVADITVDVPVTQGLADAVVAGR